MGHPGLPLISSTRIHPALTSFADECTATLARLLAYVGTLALLAMVGIHLWDQLPIDDASEPATKAGWSLAVARIRRSPSASSIFPKKQRLTRSSGIRWAAARTSFAGPGTDEKPVAELEIYRPGAEFSQSGAGSPTSPREWDPSGARELEAAGVIDSKFGPVTLLRHPGGRPRACLGFLKRLDDPTLQISGWSCQGDVLPAQRAAIGCMLNRLILLTAGNDPKLAELFARAELRRTDGAAASPAAPATDWVTSAGNPFLRGTL